MASGLWQPTKILGWGRSFPTSTYVGRVVTDAGPAFIKAQGAPEGVRPLTSEWLGTSIAKFLELDTYDFVVHDLKAWEVGEFPDGSTCLPGPAFLTREVDGIPWDGSQETLQQVNNPAQLGVLILLDTWVKNIDRFVSHPNGRIHRRADNLFISTQSSTIHPRIVAMDHSHCLLGGDPEEALVYGNFPEFSPFLNPEELATKLHKMQSLSLTEVQRWVDGVPEEWVPSRGERGTLLRFIIERARFLACQSPGFFTPSKREG